MPTVTELLVKRSALVLVRFNGVRRVRDSSGEEVEYRADSEMAAAIAAVDREIDRLLSGSHPKTIVFKTSKGL